MSLGRVVNGSVFSNRVSSTGDRYLSHLREQGGTGLVGQLSEAVLADFLEFTIREFQQRRKPSRREVSR